MKYLILLTLISCAHNNSQIYMDGCFDGVIYSQGELKKLDELPYEKCRRACNKHYDYAEGCKLEMEWEQ